MSGAARYADSRSAEPARALPPRVGSGGDEPRGRPNPSAPPSLRLAPGASRRTAPRRRWTAILAAALLVLGVAGCDDQVKYVGTFSTMTDAEEGIQTYEEPPGTPPEGAVPVRGSREELPLAAADTALQNPLRPTTQNLQGGQRAFRDFCLPCHGEAGDGTGPVMNHDGQHPQRMPALPTADLTSDRARGLSDGYIFGMITHGRGFMPSYERVPDSTRWQLVHYVRHLQQRSSQGAGADESTAGER